MQLEPRHYLIDFQVSVNKQIPDTLIYKLFAIEEFNQLHDVSNSVNNHEYVVKKVLKDDIN